MKWGFKLWVFADSEMGYTWNFQVYRGKQGETVSSNGLGFDVVMKLVGNRALLQLYHFQKVTSCVKYKHL